jgi:hypothetical protein
MITYIVNKGLLSKWLSGAKFLGIYHMVSWVYDYETGESL